MTVFVYVGSLGIREKGERMDYGIRFRILTAWLLHTPILANWSVSWRWGIKGTFFSVHEHENNFGVCFYCGFQNARRTVL